MSPLDIKEIKPVNPKGNQPWIFIGRTDAETETPVLQTSDTKSQLIAKDSDAGGNCRQEEKGVTEDEMIGWHHRLSGHEFEQTLEIVKGREGWQAAVHGITKCWMWLTEQQKSAASRAASEKAYQVEQRRPEQTLPEGSRSNRLYQEGQPNEFYPFPPVDLSDKFCPLPQEEEERRGRWSAIPLISGD